MNKKTVIIALALATAISIALEPGESEIEHNGWSRYTNSTTNLKITEPAVSRFSLERGYLRFSHQWATSFFTKMTVDIFSSDKYPEGATVRLKEAYADLTLPFINDFYLTAGLQKHYFGLIYSWDYTHPEKSLADDQGVCASADYGITVNGFLPKGFGELQLGLYNGEGYKYGGRYVNLSPELLANLRLTPITGLTVGVSVFANNADAAQYKNDRKGRDHTGSYFMNADTSNANRLAFAPMFRLVFGPVSLLGEYIGYNYTRRYSYYQLNRDSANNIVDSTLIEENKKYEFSGADLLPVITLLNRKVEIYGRFSLGNRREQKGDSIVVNNDKSFVRYGVGFNYHLVRRAKGKPGLEFQFAWQRTQPNRKETKPSDLFVAQMRFEWNSVIK